MLMYFNIFKYKAEVFVEMTYLGCFKCSKYYIAIFFNFVSNFDNSFKAAIFCNGTF